MASNKPALGRGLGALLQEEGSLRSQQQLVDSSFEIEIQRIQSNPYQPRLDFDQEALQALAKSIRQLGIIQPLTVRLLAHDRFELIAGERRLRAAKMAGLDRVPAYVRTADTEEMLEMALVENVQREDLNPVEVALGYQRLVSECGLRQDQVARRVGKTRSAVTNTLRLLRLPPRIQAALRERKLTAGHARALLGLSDDAQQLQLMEAILSERLSVRQVERRVDRLNSKPSPAPAKPSERTLLELQKYEHNLRARYSTKVRLLHDTSGKGKIELHYFSADELERVLELLLG